MSTHEATKRGRPLVFLATLTFAWIGLRLAILGAWPEVETAAPAQAEPTVQIALLSGEEVKPTVADSPTADPEVTRKALATAEPVDLDAPPPAHLKNDFDPLPAAAAHNALWMDASSGFDAVSPPPVAALGEPRGEEEF